MFYINNNDIEEMFKKAADKYELDKEMAADWNRVQIALRDDGTGMVAPAKEEKKRRKYLWFLLLIPAIMLVTYKAGYFSDKKQAEKNIGLKKLNSSSLKKQNASPGNKDDNKNAVTNNAAKTFSVNTNSSKHKKLNEHKNLLTSNKYISQNKRLFPVVNNNKTTGVKLNDILNDAENKLAHNKTLPPASITLGSNIQQNNVPENNAGNSPENKNDIDLNKTDVTPVASASKQEKQTGNYTRQAFAYTGFIGNADISFVKFQQASSPGFGLGVIGGYHFKNGISVETGILYDRKNYYTKGEYFNKNNLEYLWNVNLLSANGNCNMWEIPLTVKYDFNTQKNYNWFVTTGLSSYLMHKEYYKFKYEKNGMVNEKGYDYHNSSQNWFSMLNIGGGVNIKTGNKYFLQVQPYYKIPLSGVGKGSLSLSSAGINFSITRRLH